MSYHTHTPPGQTGQSDIPHTHTHNLKCVRKWHRSGWPDPHTYASRHLSLISPIPAAPYRNRISQKLPASRASSPECVPSPICPQMSIESTNHLLLKKHFAEREEFWSRQTGVTVTDAQQPCISMHLQTRPSSQMKKKKCHQSRSNSNKFSCRFVIVH